MPDDFVGEEDVFEPGPSADVVHEPVAVRVWHENVRDDADVQASARKSASLETWMGPCLRRDDWKKALTRSTLS